MVETTLMCCRNRSRMAAGPGTTRCVRGARLPLTTQELSECSGPTGHYMDTTLNGNIQNHRKGLKYRAVRQPKKLVEMKGFSRGGCANLLLLREMCPESTRRRGLRLSCVFLRFAPL